MLPLLEGLGFRVEGVAGGSKGAYAGKPGANPI